MLPSSCSIYPLCYPWFICSFVLFPPNLIDPLFFGWNVFFLSPHPLISKYPALLIGKKNNVSGYIPFLLKMNYFFFRLPKNTRFHSSCCHDPQSSNCFLGLWLIKMTCPTQLQEWIRWGWKRNKGRRKREMPLIMERAEWDLVSKSFLSMNTLPWTTYFNNIDDKTAQNTWSLLICDLV